MNKPSAQKRYKKKGNLLFDVARVVRKVLIHRIVEGDISVENNPAENAENQHFFVHHKQFLAHQDCASEPRKWQSAKLLDDINHGLLLLG